MVQSPLLSFCGLMVLKIHSSSNNDIYDLKLEDDFQEFIIVPQCSKNDFSALGTKIR